MSSPLPPEAAKAASSNSSASASPKQRPPLSPPRPSSSSPDRRQSSKAKTWEDLLLSASGASAYERSTSPPVPARMPHANVGGDEDDNNDDAGVDEDDDDDDDDKSNNSNKNNNNNNDNSRSRQPCSAPTNSQSTPVQLDLARLSEMLDCIPLHERFAVPGDMLLPEEIAEFERVARQRLKSFDERVKSIAMAEIRGERSSGASQAEIDLNKVKEAVMSRGSRENAPRNDENEVDDDDDSLNPADIVDWLDKVLAK